MNIKKIRARLAKKYPKPAISLKARNKTEKKSKATKPDKKKDKQNQKSESVKSSQNDSIAKKRDNIKVGPEKVLGRRADARHDQSASKHSGLVEVSAKSKGQIFDERLDKRFRKVNRRIAHGKKCKFKEPSADFAKTVAFLVQHGNFPDVACRSMGVPAPIFRKWVEAGFDDITAGVDSLCARFVSTVDAAMAQHEVKTVSKVDRRINNWQALTWLLERKSFQRWSQKNQQQQGGSFEELRARKTDIAPVVTPEVAGEVLAILEEAGALTIPGQEQPGEATIVDITGAPASVELPVVQSEDGEEVEVAPAFESDTQHERLE